MWSFRGRRESWEVWLSAVTFNSGEVIGYVVLEGNCAQLKDKFCVDLKRKEENVLQSSCPLCIINVLYTEYTVNSHIT